MGVSSGESSCRLLRRLLRVVPRMKNPSWSAFIFLTIPMNSAGHSTHTDVQLYCL